MLGIASVGILPVIFKKKINNFPRATSTRGTVLFSYATPFFYDALFGDESVGQTDGQIPCQYIIYIYMCVRVCVCVCVWNGSVWGAIKPD
jgi:hypothetical protein